MCQDPAQAALVVPQQCLEATASKCRDARLALRLVLHEKLPALLNAFDNTPAWQPLIAGVEENGHLKKAADLKSARKEFYALSTVVVEFVQKLRAEQVEFGSLKVYRCSMLRQAFPGAPSTGLWMQLEGPLRNPYFGAGMIGCGTEVK